MKPYEWQVELLPVERSGVHVIFRTTRYNDRDVNRIDYEGYISKPSGIPYEAWFEEMRIALERLAHKKEKEQGLCENAEFEFFGFYIK